MKKIKIPHQVIREIAKSFGAEAVTSDARISDLNHRLHALEWEGKTRSSFFQAWTETMQFTKQYHDELIEIERELTAIADRFQAADQARLGS